MTNTAQMYPKRIVAHATTPPFEPDFLNRKPIADRLSNYISSLKNGHTIAIDAQWGDGKTWFGLNLKAQLENNYQTVWLDAFMCDHNEDPFIPIIEKLIQLEPERDAKNKIINTAVEVGKRILPAAGKAIVAAGINWSIGKDGADALKAGLDNIDELVEAEIQRKLQSGNTDKDVIFRLKQLLTAQTNRTNKPIVFFIDELDRCRPNFAVKLIERIKHFFEAEGVIFILLINRKELEAAIKGAYGESYNATAYLDKFFDLALSLPRVDLRDEGARFYIPRIALKIAEGIGFQSQDLTHFCNRMSLPVSAFNLSLRNIERCILLYNFSGAAGSLPLTAWLIGMKVGRPHLFNQIKNRDRAATEEAIKILQEWRRPDDRDSTFLFAVHKKSIGIPLSDEEITYLREISVDFRLHPDNVFRASLDRIDLPEIR